MNDLLRITPRDNVAVALRALAAGETVAVDGLTLTLKTDVPAGHKVALTDLAEGASVVKYGFPIGYTKEAIPAGSHVHVHNLRTGLSGELSYAYQPTHPALAPLPVREFMGYPRFDGRVGIRNDLVILPTVGCVNDVARALERDAQSLVGGGVEKVYAFAHPYGCSQMGEDQDRTRQVLANLATHPNMGGVLVLGLGCENNRIAEFRKILGDVDETRVRFLNCQDCVDELGEAVRIIKELQAIAAGDTRRRSPVSKLVIGLKCGGSDGLSGVTANPKVGLVTDRLTAMGGTAVLTEIPEAFGAEAALLNRAVSVDVFNGALKLINDYKAYFIAHGQPVSENPSPGNKDGGITTLEEKSLGCILKGGRAPLTAVLGYGDFAAGGGLQLLDGPGNDIAAVTNLTAAGCHLILFTTGRGTPLGAPVPTIKIASNTALATRKPHWIDFNAQTGDADGLFELLLATANGQPTKNEINGCREIAIFKDGVTL